MKMEESAYIPNSIPPALVVFSQAGYGDAMRMQRPFSSQVDAKDSLNLSLSSSSFGLRPMESFGGLPAQLVHLQQNPFLHPALEGRFPFGSSGAFRPIVTSHNTPLVSSSSSLNSTHNSSGDNNGSHVQLKNIPSAFTSPNQSNNRRGDISGIMDCRNRDQQQEKSSAYINGGQRHRSPPNSLSPTVKNTSHKEDQDSMGDDTEENASPRSDHTDRSSPDESHNSKRRRKGGPDTLSCPVCKMALRPLELESHLLAEVEQLMCMSRIRRSQQVRDEPSASASSIGSPNGGSNSKHKEGTGTDTSQDSRWDTYHRVRANRHSRLRGKTKRRREDSGGPHVTCPVCQMPLQGTNEQFSAHVESCIRKNGDVMDEDEPVDIEGDGDAHEIQDYGWLAHRGSRASPSGNYCAINMTTNSRRRDEENDSLEVIVDDTSTNHGQVQYTESDVQSALSQSDNENNAQHDVKVRPWEDQDEDGTLGADESASGGEDGNSTILKGRVREIDGKAKSGTFPCNGNLCLICTDKYKKPVVSTVCWHVHCEHCWLKTLGIKKVCPQCNTITSPGDLRRIFL